MNFLRLYAEITQSYCRINGLPVPKLDLDRAVPNEKFECQDCKRLVLLTPSGKCGVCGSAAVISFEVIQGGKQ